LSEERREKRGKEKKRKKPQHTTLLKPLHRIESSIEQSGNERVWRGENPLTQLFPTKVTSAQSEMGVGIGRVM